MPVAGRRAETAQLWDGELSFPDLAEDIGAEARPARAITARSATSNGESPPCCTTSTRRPS